ncbi:multimeric flavodoxin WrbA [Gibbsiella quercinecans]|uniref:Flavoprotein WrbA n=2 Tax=Gibbsiella TaxID=929812 RepID=A0A250AY81_9GAMM|nr:flavodoxin family protein [Gibbsiella quercinecans]ATA18899.1 NADPH-dependent FMN reductase [Gibbsiella quercinecans]RLM08328.1 NADPH-dependent FMN reductase [Gibbsiella quercinecans]RLM12113.1 NADPH-dependent FMN reductase [Gibbsiella quercinecans]RLM15148.1 NADPH-dependent FMN reductase [Gibbsiella quercinecans]TCT91559.1 multimeric flavodoxin WrbA [Gibbsiella quercinecans]
MAKTVVIYHSGYGHTERLAKTVAEGAGAELIAIDPEGNISEQAWQTLDEADAIIFGSPTYMGGPSWQFKKFADASSKAWFAGKWKDKVFGGFTNSASLNGDKQVTLIALQTLASQHGGLWVSLGLLPANTKAAQRTDVNNLGGSVGLLAQTPADASVDEMLTGDLETATLYGQRIAAVAAKLA